MCRHCDQSYIGSTSRIVKSRMDGHCNLAQQIANGKGTKNASTFGSTSLPRHVAQHMTIGDDPKVTKFKATHAKRTVDINVLKSFDGDICIPKKFKKRGCGLCNLEKMAILKFKFRYGSDKLMNKKVGWTDRCPHPREFEDYEWS